MAVIFDRPSKATHPPSAGKAGASRSSAERPGFGSPRSATVTGRSAFVILSARSSTRRTARSAGRFGAGLRYEMRMAHGRSSTSRQ